MVLTLRNGIVQFRASLKPLRIENKPFYPCLAPFGVESLVHI